MVGTVWMNRLKIGWVVEESNLLAGQAGASQSFAGRVRIDHQMIAQMVDRYESLIFGFCFKMLGHRQDAEDATQETFSRFFKYIDRWDRTRPIEPWLIRIAGNRCRTLLSRRRQHGELSAGCVPSDHCETGDRAAALLREEIHWVLQKLPKAHRTAFELFHDEHLSYEQIAKRLDCPLGTVKTWVHRARGELIEQLQSRGVLMGEQRRCSSEVSPKQSMGDVR